MLYSSNMQHHSSHQLLRSGQGSSWNRSIVVCTASQAPGNARSGPRHHHISTNSRKAAEDSTERAAKLSSVGPGRATNRQQPASSRQRAVASTTPQPRPHKAAGTRATAGQPQAASTSHADATELRKNPELYSQPDLPPNNSSSSSLADSSGAAKGNHTPDSTSHPPAASSRALTTEVSGSMSSHSDAALPSLGRGPSSSGVASALLPNGVVLHHRPEVLAPVGGWPQLYAAVENGADAVYFGLSDFNARARAANFPSEELPQVMEYLHARGVKGYVTVNVLVFDQELQRLEQRVRQMAQAGVDAVIVQDLGVVSLVRRVAPSLPVHGSTQMTITSPEGAEFVAGLGVSRVVVGRELSVADISSVAANSSSEVEAFCHGALCVSYSGQCFSSEAWGGRSANRGQCAQACRLPYGLVVDGQLKDLGDLAYLLSPQDLAAVEQVPDMVAAGVTCFKIEGRLKGPEYVALTTRIYRNAVDAAWEALLQQQQQQAPNSSAATSSSSSSSDSSFSGQAPPLFSSRQEHMAALQQLFARGQDTNFGGLTPGFLEGPQHQMLVRGRSPRHRGVCLGEVASVTKRGVVVKRLQQTVKPGDGLVFDQGRPQQEEQGGQIYALYNPRTSKRLDGAAVAGGAAEIVFGPGQVDLGRVTPGDLLWRNKDPALDAKVRSTYESVSSSAARKLPVAVAVSGALGQPLTLRLTDAQGHSAVADTGEQLLQPARRQPLTTQDVLAALGQLGDNTLVPSGFDLSGLQLEQSLFLPASALKAVRRAAAEQLLKQQQQHGRAEGLSPQPVLPQMKAEALQRRPTLAAVGAGQSSVGAPVETSSNYSSSSSSSRARVPNSSSSSSCGSHGSAAQEPVLRVLCRTPQQVAAALKVPWLDEIILDLLEVHGLKEAVAQVKASGKRAVAALPRIFKPGEQRLMNFYLRLEADALLLRSTGALHQLQQLGGPGSVVPGLQPWSQHSNSSSSSSKTSAHDDWAVAGTADAQPQQSSSANTTSSSSSSSSIRQDMDGCVRVPELEGDFSLNVANVLSADLLLSSCLSRLAPTHDLNGRQLVELGRSFQAAGRAAALEVVVHQHLPIFHTEHCVFCRFLSDGNSFKDCGHPCEHHLVHLRDQSSADHLVLADMGCRNTVFNAQSQSGAYFLRDLAAAGYGAFRVELVDEPAEVVGELLEGYRRVVQGEWAPGKLWQWLQQLPDANGRVHGVSAGSLEVVKERGVEQMKPTASALKAAAA